MAEESSGGAFRSWVARWDAEATYTGPTVPDVETRIRAIVELWREPSPSGDWMRGPDARLLQPDARYLRGNSGELATRRGEHVVEYEILKPSPLVSTTTILGGRLADGVDAVPLSTDVGGGRGGNVEADMLLLVRHGATHRLVLVEVKTTSNNSWYAAVENLRQLWLLRNSDAPQRIFHERRPELELPEQLGTRGVVLAPVSYYAAAGARDLAVAPAQQLLARMRAELDVDVVLATWDPKERVVAELAER